jgi:serine/alanine adding enzyme
MQYPDIYYLPQWSKLNAAHDNGISEEYYFHNEYGEIYYPYVKKEIETRLDGQVYYDTVTPYGFNGPIILTSSNTEKLLEEFDINFTEHCLINNIIAEYVRFSPWLMNHVDFKNNYNLKYNNQTLFIDLKKNFFIEEFSGKSRNVIRKAQKSNVLVKFDFTGIYINEFYELYKQMAVKNNISSYYMFDKKYIEETFRAMNGHVFIASALYNDQVISSSMFLYNDNYIHYHLSGNNYDYTSLGANSLILNEVSKWGQEQGIKQFHLGGAFDKGLYKFKSGFTKTGFLEYYVGTSIRDEENYQNLIKLVGKNETGYFPEYRR